VGYGESLLGLDSRRSKPSYPQELQKAADKTYNGGAIGWTPFYAIVNDLPCSSVSYSACFIVLFREFYALGNPYAPASSLRWS
jgi:hypothetical protein